MRAWGCCSMIREINRAYRDFRIPIFCGIPVKPLPARQRGIAKDREFPKSSFPAKTRGPAQCLCSILPECTQGNGGVTCLTVNVLFLANAAVITNGFPNEFCKARGKIVIVQQFAGGSTARICRGRNLTQENACIHQRCDHKRNNNPLSGH